jgi:acetylornithine/N-succinyldiaminopimelate aminotransferase
MMVDEVQTGFARTGEWFGFQHYGVMPDVVTMAKALGNGFPIGACWAKREVAAAFKPGDHATTYGGTPLATAAAAAVLAEMERIDAPTLSRTRAAELTAALVKVPGVKEVRGLGLLIAVELATKEAKPVADELLRRGLVVNAVTATALRLAPPLNVSSAEIATAVAMIRDVLE